MNYYMAFGGTTFGRQVGGPLIITSYDYDVQINEYGLRAEPKFSLTAKLHNILMDASNILLSENSLPLPKPVPLPGSNSCETHTYYCAKCNQCIQFLSNYGVSNECSFPSDAGVDTHAFAVPAWSVSILRGDYMRGQCLNTEELINTKTSTVSDPDIKASNYQVPQLVEGIDFTFQKNLHDPVPYEMREDDPRKKTQIVKNAPVEQLTLTEDKTDYLWYSVNIPRVDTGLRGSISFVTGIGGGSVGYVYANGVFVGSTLTQNGHSPVLSMLPIENMTTIEATVTSIIDVELPLSCRIKCQIDVLSMNMGIKNYGPYLELVKTGIISAITWKSEFSEWVELSPVTHTVGLLGESGRNIGIIADMGDDTLRENAPLQWYSMSFPSPPHLNVTSDNYALELVSPDTGSNSHVMGKGAVWVNGMMLGRYWDAIGSTAIADCDDTCVANQVNWVGAYSPERCTSGCTIPSQTQYKLPTSLLNTDGNDNILILFEEIGGSPSKIKLNEIVMKEY